MDFPEKLSIPPLADSTRSSSLAAIPKRETVAPKDHLAQTDAVHLTNHGRNVKNAIERSRQIPDVREDRISALQQQIERGTYRIQKDRIASNLMAENMENNKAMESIDTDG